MPEPLVTAMATQLTAWGNAAQSGLVTVVGTALPVAIAGFALFYIVKRVYALIG